MIPATLASKNFTKPSEPIIGMLRLGKQLLLEVVSLDLQQSYNSGGPKILMISSPPLFGVPVAIAAIYMQ